MASLSWSDAPRRRVEQSDAKYEKPTAAFGGMTVFLLIDDITYEGFRFFLSDGNTLCLNRKSTKMPMLGWLSVVLEKVENFTNWNLQYFSQVIKSCH